MIYILVPDPGLLFPPILRRQVFPGQGYRKRTTKYILQISLKQDNGIENWPTKGLIVIESGPKETNSEQQQKEKLSYLHELGCCMHVCVCVFRWQQTDNGWISQLSSLILAFWTLTRHWMNFGMKQIGDNDCQWNASHFFTKHKKTIPFVIVFNWTITSSKKTSTTDLESRF